MGPRGPGPIAATLTARDNADFTIQRGHIGTALCGHRLGLFGEAEPWKLCRDRQRGNRTSGGEKRGDSEGKETGHSDILGSFPKG